MSEKSETTNGPALPGSAVSDPRGGANPLPGHQLIIPSCDGVPLTPAAQPFRCAGFAAFMRGGFAPGDEEMVARKFEAADAEIARLRKALEGLDAMYRRIAPNDPDGLHPALHPAWKACKEALSP